MPDPNQNAVISLTALPGTNPDRPPSRTARSRALPALNLDLPLALTPAAYFQLQSFENQSCSGSRSLTYSRWPACAPAHAIARRPRVDPVQARQLQLAFFHSCSGHALRATDLCNVTASSTPLTINSMFVLRQLCRPLCRTPPSGSRSPRSCSCSRLPPPPPLSVRRSTSGR